MDLSRLSDSDLEALQAGDLSKVSSGGLAYLAGQAEPQKPSGSYGADVVSNIWPSAKRYAGNIADAVLHPLDTARGVVDLGAGALQNALPEALVQAIGEEPESRKVASAAGEGLAQRYGSPERIAETFRTDPVGVAGDASMLLTGGASGARMATLPKVAKVLDKAATLTNPVNVVNNPVTRKALSAAADVPTQLIGGVTTGAGSSSLTAAYDATRRGGNAAEAYWDNLRKKVPPDEVLNRAQEGIQNLRKAMADRYKVNKDGSMGWAADKTPLSFQGVEQAYADAIDKFSFKGTPQPGISPVASDIRAVLDDWKTKAAADPAYLSIEGLDALKRHLAQVYPTDVANRSGRSFASAVVDGVKQTISAQAPTYRAALHEYWKDASKLDDITRELSLGPKANTGTTLRKLQSLMRSNAGAGWEYRQDLGRTLAEAGGDLMPGLAGQALSSVIPRGLAKWGEGALVGGSLAAGGMGPALAVAPMGSPRLMGEVYGGLGTVARGLNKGKQAVVGVTQPQHVPTLSEMLNASAGLEELASGYQ